MQFIDQSAAYNKKSISLPRAIELGRAKVTAGPDTGKIARCFRADLKVATDFDRAIDARLRFFDLSTPAKMDLMIDELLPGFYHPDLLAKTGRDRWTVRFVIDGDVDRCLTIDATGLGLATPEHARTPDAEIETDIMTLMAILRSLIAEHHLNTPDVTAASVTNLSAG